MADNLTNTEENRLLDLSLPTTALACTMKLRSSAPSETADGTTITGGGYADKTFTVAAASGGSKSNTADISFGPATGSPWAEIQGYDVYVGAERRWYQALAAPDRRTVGVGDTYVIDAGTLSFALS